LNPTATYDYASGDLLENRNTYFYTKFQGDEFLAAWRSQRSESVASQSGVASSVKYPDTAPVHQLLEKIHLGLSGNDSHTDALWLLDRVLQRFEVTKRLHGEYNANWRPIDPQDYHDMERYVRFAEVLDLAYVETSKLPFLNALLKCMDTLTALVARLDSSQKDRVRHLIVHERDYVDRLIQKVGTQVDKQE